MSCKGQGGYRASRQGSDGQEKGTGREKGQMPCKVPCDAWRSVDLVRQCIVSRLLYGDGTMIARTVGCALTHIDVELLMARAWLSQLNLSATETDSGKTAQRPAMKATACHLS